MPLSFPMDTLNTSNTPANPSPDFPRGVCVNHTRPSKLFAKAFSLIELLVVIGLLGVLSAMLVITISKLKTNGKRQQTHLILLNLQAMFSEADSVQHFSYGVGRVDYDKIDYGLTTKPNQQIMLRAIAMDCPENVTVENSLIDAPDPDRWGIPTANDASPNPAVRFTRDFMAALMQFPATSAAISKLPAGSLMTFPPTNFATLGNTFGGTPVAWATGTTYNLGGAYLRNGGSNPDQASDNNATTPTYYIRTQIYADSTGLANPYGQILPDDTGTNGDSALGPPNPAYWLPELPGLPAVSTTLPLSTPVVLDAWNNPIIFVFGGVLGNGAPLNTNNTVIHKSGAMVVGGITFQQASPDHRPFFASAGPDGDFSKGDDNMYSFEK